MKKAFNNRFLIFALLLLFDGIGFYAFSLLSFSQVTNSWPNDLFLNFNMLALLFIQSGTLSLFELYSVDNEKSGPRLLARVIVSVFCAGVLTIIIAYIVDFEKGGMIGRGALLGALLGFTFWATSVRYLFLRFYWIYGEEQRWLIISDLESTTKIWNDHLADPQRKKLLFLIDEWDETTDYGKIPIIGMWEDLKGWIHQPWNGIVIGTQKNMKMDLLEELLVARLNGLRVWSLVGFYEQLWGKIPLFHLEDDWFIRSGGFDLLHDPMGLKIKRLVDFFCSAILVIVFLPVIFLTGLLIRLESRGPIIYRQTRIGEDGKPFVIYKFRSMATNAEKDGAQWAQLNDSRITRVGKFIRKTRIDEIPQVLNVLKGDMSFIGPRPERPEFTSELEREIPYFSFRSLVKPGITGWAQVLYSYGSSQADALEKLQFDLYYIKNHSLFLDLVILFRTVRVVVFGKGV